MLVGNAVQQLKDNNTIFELKNSAVSELLVGKCTQTTCPLNRSFGSSISRKNFPYLMLSSPTHLWSTPVLVSHGFHRLLFFYLS